MDNLVAIKLSLRNLRDKGSRLVGLSRSDSASLPHVPKQNDRGNKLAVVAIVKNEQAYIGEWLEFYILQGASRFIIYDNGSTDDTARIVKAYAQFVDCELIPWNTFFDRDEFDCSLQAMAYAHAIVNFGPAVRWMAFLDIDEFLFSTSGNRLASALEEFDDLPSLSVPWTNFGPGGHIEKPSGLVIENYRECALLPLPLNQLTLLRYKSIIDPAEAAAMGTHFIPLREQGRVFFNERREHCPIHDARNLKFACSQKFQLNHYFTRSESEIAGRIAKGRVSKNGKLQENYINRRLTAYKRSTAEDTKILRFVPELKAQMSAHKPLLDRALNIDPLA